MALVVVDPPFGAYPASAMQRSLIRWFHSTPLGFSRARRWAINTFKAHGDGPVDAALFGLKVRFNPYDNHTDGMAALCGRSFNAAELNWLNAALNDGGTFVDLGANMGFFTLAAAKRASAVLAVEPNPTLYSRLEVNLALNGFTSVRTVRTAVGDCVGEVILGSMKDLGAAGIVEKGDGLLVPVKPLLDLLNEAGMSNIDVLKIDIEGYEDRALLPFFSTAPQSLFPRSIITEVSSGDHWAGNLMASLKEHGYRVRARSRGNVWLERRS